MKLIELTTQVEAKLLEKPPFQAETLRIIPKNTQILQLQVLGEWFKVIFKDKSGYIHTNYVVGYANTVNSKRLLNFAEQYLYYPYKKDSLPLQDSHFNASSYVQWVFAHIGIEMPATALLQSIEGTLVKSHDLKSGDLVFFSDKDSMGQITTVGIYVESGSFITVTERNGVVYQNLYTGYWDEHYVKAKRILVDE